ncbi:alkylhydroperoxidase AhpD family core domain-containing protein [Catalinimonas alkaloidigena]|uniref:Alkylhydroperoxidase AhpD family core domain-containing protein n=1 Tax=Catalinimonas alkaloidigena TaxID=1075417 RepID=A0A1G9T0N7_9BACT|nr:alkylhydroperoxidase [Catalinimonas alkaloidigena]SDM41206.1 alkylhydroperoxidase AhpD family core domain-containing protein [Catalinimonas alkaloidigena]
MQTHFHARFPLVEFEAASPEVKLLYQETMREMGLPFVLNWFKCQGANAILLRGNWEKLKCTLLRGKVPLVLKQLIIYHISRQKGCLYCAHVHGIAVNQLASTLTDQPAPSLTEDLDQEFVPASYRQAIRVVTKCAMDAHATSDDDFEALRAEGFSDQEIQELMSMADLTNMLNTIADIAGIPIDDELLSSR